MSNSEESLKKLCTFVTDTVFIPHDALDPDLYIARELLTDELSAIPTEVLNAGYTKMRTRHDQNEIHLAKITDDLTRVIRELEMKKTHLMHIQNDYQKCSAVKQLIEQFGVQVELELEKRL
jgi:hypothetical protein